MTDRITLLNKIQNELNSKRIIIVQGLRRIGKTTLMNSICDEIVKSESLIVVRYTFNMHLSNDDAYVSALMNQLKGEKNYLLFFDEFQDYPDWQRFFKTIYDQFPNVRVVATGSVSHNNSSAPITEGGRFFIINMFPLSFSEYMNIFGSLSYKDVVLDNISDYISRGSYPSPEFRSSIDLYKKYINDNILEKITSVEMIKSATLDSSRQLMMVLKHIISNIGSYLSINGISESLGIKGTTVEKCISYLIHNFIIFEINNETHQKGRAMIWGSKYYLNDHSFYQFIKPLGFKELQQTGYEEDRKYASFVFENFVINQIRYENVFVPNQITFVKNKEFDIDFVWELNGRQFYFEIKLTNDPDCLSKDQYKFATNKKLNVIYMGPSGIINGVNYINAFDFFKDGVDKQMFLDWK